LLIRQNYPIIVNISFCSSIYNEKYTDCTQLFSDAIPFKPSFRCLMLLQDCGQRGMITLYAA